ESGNLAALPEGLDPDLLERPRRGSGGCGIEPFGLYCFKVLHGRDPKMKKGPMLPSAPSLSFSGALSARREGPPPGGGRRRSVEAAAKSKNAHGVLSHRRGRSIGAPNVGGQPAPRGGRRLRDAAGAAIPCSRKRACRRST